jgi:transposase
MCEHECNKIKELQEVIISKDNEIVAIEAKNKVLESENEALKKELEKHKKPPKDSSNSSIPPSQDPYRKPYPDREKSDKKSGGQKGHKGETRMLSNDPDRKIRPLFPMECPNCGGVDFIYDEDKVKEIRQVVDIPPPVKPEVTEYQQKSGICTCCGRKCLGEFPANIKASVQIGDRTKAIVGLLHVEHHSGYQRTTRILNDLYCLKISEGSVKNILDDLQKVLKPEYDNILENLKESLVIGSDETRLRINGINAWLWIFQNDSYTYFASEYSRGFAVIEKIIGNLFNGIWVSDRLGTQLKILAIHQLCLAHLLRQCKFAMKAECSEWAEKLKSLFQEAIKFRKKRGKDFNPQETEDFREVQKFKKRLKEIFQKPPPLEEEKKLFNGLVGRQNQLFQFLENNKVPYDNNGSERGLRNRVVHRKVTGGFRTPEGAHCHDVIASVIETAKKQGKNILDEILRLLRQNQFLLST